MEHYMGMKPAFEDTMVLDTIKAMRRDKKA